MTAQCHPVPTGSATTRWIPTYVSVMLDMMGQTVIMTSTTARHSPVYTACVRTRLTVSPVAVTQATLEIPAE